MLLVYESHIFKMPKPIHFCLLLTTLSILHVSYNGVEGGGNTQESQNTKTSVTSEIPISPFSSLPIVDPLGISEDEVSKIREQVLGRSNMYRKLHKLEEFKISTEINNYAQTWANDLATRRVTESRPKKDRIYGDNIIESDPIPFAADLGGEAIDICYNSIGFVEVTMVESDFNNNINMQCLTQLLWKTSKEIGVGVSVSEDSKYRLVISYKPSGNLKNQYQENLPKFEQKQIDAGKKALGRFGEQAGLDTIYTRQSDP